jgi:hypothetical protein
MDDGSEKLAAFFRETGLAYPERPTACREPTGRHGRRGLWVVLGLGVIASYLWSVIA